MKTCENCINCRNGHCKIFQQDVEGYEAGSCDEHEEMESMEEYMTI